MTTPPVAAWQGCWKSCRPRLFPRQTVKFFNRCTEPCKIACCRVGQRSGFNQRPSHLGLMLWSAKLHSLKRCAGIPDHDKRDPSRSLWQIDKHTHDWDGKTTATAYPPPGHEAGADMGAVYTPGGTSTPTSTVDHSPDLILVALITGNSSLEPLIEGLYAQIHVNLRWRVFGRNRTGDLTDY